MWQNSDIYHLRPANEKVRSFFAKFADSVIWLKKSSKKYRLIHRNIRKYSYLKIFFTMTERIDDSLKE